MLLTWNHGKSGYVWHVYVFCLLIKEEPYIHSQKCGKGVPFYSLILQILKSCPSSHWLHQGSGRHGSRWKTSPSSISSCRHPHVKKMIRVCQARPWLNSGNFIPDLYPVRTGIRVASLKYDKTQPPQTNGCYPRSASSAHVRCSG